MTGKYTFIPNKSGLITIFRSTMGQLQTSIVGLESVYENSPNFRIQTGTGKVGYIFFSGNGLYFPNTDEEFHRTVIEKNRFEWSSLIPDSNNYSKALFLRDVKKTWYVDGISKTHNTIDKVLRLLKQEFSDIDELICVGNSAGGYAANLFGILLGAKQIFSISGFFCLTPEIVNDPHNPYLQIAKHDPEKSQWFDLVPLLQTADAKRCAINFIYSSGCHEDVEQAAIGKPYLNVRLIAIQSAIHGKNIPGFAYPILIRLKQNKIDRIYKNRPELVWHPKLFAFRVLGPAQFIIKLASRFLRKIFPPRAAKSDKKP